MFYLAQSGGGPAGRRLWRSFSCHLGFPGPAGRMEPGHPRPRLALKFTDDEVFLAQHPGPDCPAAGFYKRK